MTREQVQREARRLVALNEKFRQQIAKLKGRLEKAKSASVKKKIDKDLAKVEAQRLKIIRQIHHLQDRVCRHPNASSTIDACNDCLRKDYSLHVI